MISLGVDPSSSVTGLAVAIDDELTHTEVFRADPKIDIERNMAAFRDRLIQMWFEFGTVDIVVVEKVSVQWNVNTIRKIAYFEAVAMLRGADAGCAVIPVQATRARKTVLGSGGLSKEVCYGMMKEMFPHRVWLGPKEGGMDETDAAVLALAGPALRDAAPVPKRKKARK